MEKISTGIKDLDNLIDSAYIGDNVVWEIEAGTSIEVFILNFMNQSLIENMDVIYVSFNKSPQSILQQLGNLPNPEKLTVLDSFTSGKGKNDRAFLKFYDGRSTEYPRVIKIDRPSDINSFTETLNSIQDKTYSNARYVFDSMTGMQDLWDNENNTYKFFTYMCPRLYDLGTVAYWILEKEAHSQKFRSNLRHITQVVIELYKKNDKLFLKALKLDGRSSREAFKPHSYETEDNIIHIVPLRKKPLFEIGGEIRDSRTRLGISQKELADKIGTTSSFISQLENNQISPSLNSFFQIAEILGINPKNFLEKERKRNDASWLVTAESVRENIYEKQQGYSIFSIFSGDKASAYLTVINPDTELNQHFLNFKKEELIHVIKGDVSVKIENRQKKLKTGDSVYLKESLPSLWINKTKEEAELLVIYV